MLKFETPIDRVQPALERRSIPGHAHVGPPSGQWMMYRSTWSTPSRRRLCSSSASRIAAGPGRNFVVMNTSSRGNAAVTQRRPTLASLP